MSKSNLKQQAYQSIRTKIMNCEYPPGMLLNENIILEEFSGSRTPIRDALGRLEQERLVTILPKKGILVAGLSLHDLGSIYETRLLIEPQALLHYGNTLPESLYLEHFEFFNDIAATRSSIDQTYQIDDSFHIALINATNNPYLIQLYELVSVQTHRSRILSGKLSGGRLDESRREHLDILVACLKGDWITAADNLRIHLNNSKTAIIQVLSPAHIAL